MYGIFAASLGFVLHLLALYSIGIGLFIDEATYLLVRGKTHSDNYSAASLLGTAILVVATFYLRKMLANVIK